MMNAEKYLDRNEINDYLDNLFLTSLNLYKKVDGMICPICKIKQGSSHKGWKKYYCKHIEQKINQKLKKYNKEALKKELIFISKYGLQK